MLAHLTVRSSVQPTPAEAHPAAAGRAKAQAPVPPVAPPQLAHGLAPPERSRGAESHLALPAPASAEAAAEAARRAYIRASIAAGLNPLPLPGR